MTRENDVDPPFGEFDFYWVGYGRAHRLLELVAVSTATKRISRLAVIATNFLSLHPKMPRATMRRLPPEEAEAVAVAASGGVRALRYLDVFLIESSEGCFYVCGRLKHVSDDNPQRSIAESL